jgi:hypothetical protein
VQGRIVGMTRINLDSSNIKSAGYDPATDTLEVEFANGSIYTYSDVSPAVYEAMIGAESPGKYFAANIRGKYPTEKKS